MGEIWAATPPVLEDAQYILDLVVLVNHARSRAATPRPPGRRSRIRRWPPTPNGRMVNLLIVRFCQLGCMVYSPNAQQLEIICSPSWFCPISPHLLKRTVFIIGLSSGHENFTRSK